MHNLHFSGAVFFLCSIWLGNAQTYLDRPYKQDFSIQYENEALDTHLWTVGTDRNKNSFVLSSKGLLMPWEGKLKKSYQYRPLQELNLLGLKVYKNEFYYLTPKAVLNFSNGGAFSVAHGLIDPTHFDFGAGELLLVLNDNWLRVLGENALLKQELELPEKAVALHYDAKHQYFLILSSNRLYQFKPSEKKLKEVFSGDGLTAIVCHQSNVILGTKKGLHILNRTTFQQEEFLTALPHTEITDLNSIEGKLWVGTKKGAFAFRADGKYDYYVSRRWLVDDEVTGIAPGPDQSVLILTKKGLNQIAFKWMTLAQKAAYFQRIQRQRHIRYGLESTVRLNEAGDLSTLELIDTDNDGLWTSMYLAGELFRYAATQSDEAKQNALEAFEAMERLTEISGIEGFPARTYELDSYQNSNWKANDTLGTWQKANNPKWVWKTTTSSDESCGHFFVNALFAELIQDETWKKRAVALLKKQMDHIIANDWYLVSWDGKPTRWGRWHPDYVNSFPPEVGDRRLNSTLILAFLQSTYYFTQEEKYKELALMLAKKYGYEENANRMASTIGFVEGELLSDAWNHSDDEMYFLTAPAFVNYAFDAKTKAKHLASVASHWEIERSEKNPLWNFLYALSGGKNIDLEDSIWWLKEFPMDLIDWKVENQHRKDVTPLPPNFRKQEYTEVLPPDERPLHLHNRAYQNNGGSGGYREYSPYVYLLPYWTGRYLGYIGSK